MFKNHNPRICQQSASISDGNKRCRAPILLQIGGDYRTSDCPVYETSKDGWERHQGMPNETHCTSRAKQADLSEATREANIHLNPQVFQNMDALRGLGLSPKCRMASYVSNNSNSSSFSLRPRGQKEENRNVCRAICLNLIRPLATTTSGIYAARRHNDEVSAFWSCPDNATNLWHLERPLAVLSSLIWLRRQITSTHVSSVPLPALNIHRGLDLAPVALRKCLHDYPRTFAISSVKEEELTAHQHGLPSHDLSGLWAVVYILDNLSTTRYATGRRSYGRNLNVKCHNTSRHESC